MTYLLSISSLANCKHYSSRLKAVGHNAATCMYSVVLRICSCPYLQGYVAARTCKDSVAKGNHTADKVSREGLLLRAICKHMHQKINSW